jgi:hypothetical protein
VERARFQFSFKIRPLTPTGNVSEAVAGSLLRPTRRPALWDLQSLSEPFYGRLPEADAFTQKDAFDVKSPWFDRLGDPDRLTA